MTTIESTNDPEVVRQQFAERGIKMNVSGNETGEPETEKVAEEDTSGKPATEEVAGDKTASESETGETTTQETPSQGETKTKGEPNRSADKKIGKLTAQLESAREDLDTTRGDKSKLAAKVEELEARIAELQPKTDEKQALTRPKRPETPELSDFEYDVTKFQAAMKQHRKDMDAYDEKLEAYQDAKAAKTAEEALQSYQTARETAEREASGAKAAKIFAEKYTADAAEIDGWEDFWADRPQNDPQFEYGVAVDAALKRADHPARVVWHLANNLKELKRINEMDDPVAQVAAIGRLDARFDKQEKQEPKEAPKLVVTEKKMTLQPEKKATAQPQRTRTQDAPITPVNGGATTAPTNPDAAYQTYIANGDTKGFVAEFNRRQAERMRAKLGR